MTTHAVYRTNGGKEAPITAIKQVRIVLLDFDGVLTNNRVTTDSAGMESVVTNKYDSLAIAAAQEHHSVYFAVFTMESSCYVAYRCNKLDIPFFVCEGHTKLGVATRHLESIGKTWRNAVFVGNDYPDVPCMVKAQVSCAPQDASAGALGIADIILKKNGGDGVVREVLNYMLGDSWLQKIYAHD